MENNTGKICPLCKTEIRDEDPAKVCPACGVSHHEICWENNNGCAVCDRFEPDHAAQESEFAEKVSSSFGGSGKTQRKRLPLILCAVAAAVVVIILMITLGGGKKDFNEMFSEYADEIWCQIPHDGSYISIDTNPLNIEDEVEYAAWRACEEINSKLGFSAALGEKMSKTRSIDGRQNESNDQYAVSWSFHPDHGLEVTYELIQ